MASSLYVDTAAVHRLTPPFPHVTPRQTRDVSPIFI